MTAAVAARCHAGRAAAMAPSLPRLRIQRRGHAAPSCPPPPLASLRGSALDCSARALVSLGRWIGTCSDWTGGGGEADGATFALIFPEEKGSKDTGAHPVLALGMFFVVLETGVQETRGLISSFSGAFIPIPWSLRPSRSAPLPGSPPSQPLASD